MIKGFEYIVAADGSNIGSEKNRARALRWARNLLSSGDYREVKVTARTKAGDRLILLGLRQKVETVH